MSLLPFPVDHVLAPEQLHPALWRASQMGVGRHAVTATGFLALDAELPGGGWPHRALTELLLPHPGLGEMRLLAPALAHIAGRAGDTPVDAGRASDTPVVAGRVSAATRAGDPAGERCVMLFDPPAALSGWALAQMGLDTRPWVIVHGRAGAASRRLLPSADLLWALEQALKSGHVGAVLAWLPLRLRADALRRLQLAAQAHDGPVILLRESEARNRPSPAPLRLVLQAAGIDELSVRVLKRRGPVLAQPLRLVLPPVLTARQRQRALARRQVADVTVSPVLSPVVPPSATALVSAR